MKKKKNVGQILKIKPTNRERMRVSICIGSIENKQLNPQQKRSEFDSKHLQYNHNQNLNINAAVEQ